MENTNQIDFLTLIRNVINFIKKYFKIIILSILVALLAGILNHFYGKKYYKTTIIATSPVINKQIVYELVSPVRLFILSEQYDSVSEKLNIPYDVAKSIRYFDLDTGITNAVKISVHFYDVEKLGKFSEGLMNYLNEIPYVKNTIESRRKYVSQLLQDINKEIAELNTLQANIIAISSESNVQGSVYAGDIFKQMLDLHDRKTLLEEELSKLQKFTIINNQLFIRSNKSLTKSVAVSFVIGFLLGLLVSAIIEIKKKL